MFHYIADYLFSIYFLLILLSDSLELFSTLLIDQDYLVCLIYSSAHLFVSLLIPARVFCSCQGFCVPLCNFLMSLVDYFFVLLTVLLADVSHLFLFLISLLIEAYSLVLVLLLYCLCMQSDSMLFFCTLSLLLFGSQCLLLFFNKPFSHPTV